MASSGPLPSWLMVVAALGGLPFTWGVAYSFYAQNKQQSNWLRVEGKVIRSGLIETTRNSTKKHRLDVRYAYLVNGRRYESESVGGVVLYYTSKSKAQSKAAEYPVGRAVTALVNPDHPEEALPRVGALLVGNRAGLLPRAGVGRGVAGGMVFHLFGAVLAAA